MRLWGPYKQGYFNPVKLLVGFWMIQIFVSQKPTQKTPETNFDHFGGCFPMVRDIVYLPHPLHHEATLT